MCPDEKPAKWSPECDLSWHEWSKPGHEGILVPIFGGRHYAYACLECLAICLIERGQTKADIIADIEYMVRGQYPGETI